MLFLSINVKYAKLSQSLPKSTINIATSELLFCKQVQQTEARCLENTIFYRTGMVLVSGSKITLKLITVSQVINIYEFPTNNIFIQESN